ncbi:hypothetical protein [Streptomyces sp. A 4/2]|uniref:hypothetical protein n=1 Tax=Streptomyces sp. A 4/2 TaxID=2934314 RepID=UPI0020240107|nr:hypothetical protein [Streptomyces sp. A 4/2]
MTVMTSAEDVLREFCTTRRTQAVFVSWKSDPKRAAVVPVVMEHRAKAIYELSAADVREVCNRTEHALGDVRREEGEAVRAIVDWNPDFAFTHMFHVCLERGGNLPTYQQFRQFAETDSLGMGMLGTPVRRRVEEVTEGGVANHLAKAAMRWRVGNAYYSFLREVYTLVELRSRGVDLRMHPLADALFRVDGWVGRRALSLRVSNRKFRAGMTSGRKTPAEQLLADVLPPLEFETIELTAATKFGKVHLPSREHIDAASASLLREE